MGIDEQCYFEQKSELENNYQTQMQALCITNELAETLANNLMAIKQEYNDQWSQQISHSSDEEFLSMADSYRAKMLEISEEIEKNEKQRQQDLQLLIFTERKIACLQKLENFFCDQAKNGQLPNPCVPKRPEVKLTPQDLYYKVSLMILFKLLFGSRSFI